jgi:hypothetical protein
MPTPSRSVFYGFGAWVGQQTGTTSCTWYPQDPVTLAPQFDPNKLIPNNLAANPNAHLTKAMPITDIQVDDAPPHGALTRLGPTFPNGLMIQSLWMEATHYNALAANKKPARIPSDFACRDFELTTVLYWSGPLANRRFWGFYVEINSEAAPSALVSIWPAGKSLDAGQGPALSVWLDLSVQCHPIEASFTTVGCGAGAKKGALFIDAPTVISLGLGGPKLPKATGNELYPSTR